MKIKELIINNINKSKLEINKYFNTKIYYVIIKVSFN